MRPDSSGHSRNHTVHACTCIQHGGEVALARQERSICLCFLGRAVNAILDPSRSNLLYPISRVAASRQELA